MSFVILLLSAAAAAGSPQTTDGPPASAFAVAPIDTGSLDRETAREDTSQVAVSDQASTVSHNTINGPSVTGQVSIDGNAFQNLQGLAIINANSGNNVSVNASLTVNLQFTPAP